MAIPYGNVANNQAVTTSVGTFNVADTYASLKLKIKIPTFVDGIADWYEFFGRTNYDLSSENNSIFYPDLEERLIILSLLIQANPDLRNVPDSSTALVHQNCRGNGFFPDKNIFQVRFTVYIGEKGVDKWWGTSDFGKYGFIAWNQVSPKMPVTFLNFPECQVYSAFDEDGFRYSLAPGVVGEFVTYQRVVSKRALQYAESDDAYSDYTYPPQ